MDSEMVPRLAPELLRDCHGRQAWRHGTRLVSFILLYAVAAVVAVIAAERVTAWWQYGLLAPVYLLAAASLHGISLFTHEAVHGTLSRNRILNDLLGAACAIPVLQNCSAYRVLHLRHHAHLGEEGDPDHYANYTRWTWLVFGMNWARLLVGYDHLEHHLYPGVPWHHLPEVHKALAGELRERGAPYIPSYASFVREFTLGSLKRSPLGWRRTSK